MKCHRLTGEITFSRETRVHSRSLGQHSAAVCFTYRDFALNQQLPVGVKNASVRKQNVPISPVERNVYTVEGDLWRVTMEPNDDEYHLEISARGAPRISKRIIVEIPPDPSYARARVANCCHFFQGTIFLSRKRFETSSSSRFQFE